MSDELETIKINGQEFRLGCNVPDAFPTALPPITTAPGFRVWSKAEIEDYVKRLKPIKRREMFTGPEWIVNQGGVGSCNAAAAVGALRRTMYLTGRNEVPLLNWEFLYAMINGGRDRGSLLVDGMDVLQRIGAPPLDLRKHPINKHIFKNQYDSADLDAAGAWKAEACYAIDDELELATYILTGGAAVVAVHAGNNFMRLNSQGIAGSLNGPGNHAVLCDDVEIIDGELAFDMANSWGAGYGANGRAYLTWARHFRQTVSKHRFYSCMAASNPGGVPVA